MKLIVFAYDLCIILTLPGSLERKAGFIYIAYIL